MARYHPSKELMVLIKFLSHRMPRSGINQLPRKSFHYRSSAGEPDTLFQTPSKHPWWRWTPIRGLRVAHKERQGFWRCKPQIAVHAGVGSQVQYEKASEKDPQLLLHFVAHGLPLAA